MHKLMEYICNELEELERKAEKDGKLSMAEIQYVDTLAHAKKNLLKADEMWNESEYSMTAGPYYSGRHSYAGRRNAKRDAMGRYSRDGMMPDYSRAKEDFRMELEGLMNDAPNDQVRMKLQRLMSEM